MSKVVIISDDLTGANATSVLLGKQGFQAATFLDLHQYDPDKNRDLDIVSISTDSRGIDGESAYEKVAEVVDYFKDQDVRFFCKRIDSTLRGNIGREISAVLDGLDQDTVAMMVASFPSSGRKTIGGHMLVNGIPLDETDVVKDPKTPVYYSNIRTIVSEEYEGEIGLVDLDIISSGVERVRDKILDYYDRGCRLILFDAMADEDIYTIAKGIKMADKKVITVDPGPLTAALTHEILARPTKEMKEKIMLTIGSVTAVTKRQVLRLKRKEKTFFVETNTRSLLYEETQDMEIRRVADLLLDNILKYEVIGVVTTGEHNEVLDLERVALDLDITEDEVSQRIANSLGEITRRVFEARGDLIGGLFTSGGDITVATCKALGAVGIEVKDEILPLAVYGLLKEGQYDRKSIVTKGGLIGDDKALVKCVEYMKRKIQK